MHERWILFGMVLLAATGPTARADGEIEDLVHRLDAAVASVAGSEIGPAADDASYLRRVWIDLAGHSPPASVARDFLDDASPEKRARMVARLLDSEDFADHWGRVIALWLTSERPIARDTYDGRVLHEFLREGLLGKVPYDRMIRELLVGSGASDSSGPADF